MKTLTKNLAKRSLSVLLVLMMVFSLLTVGLTSASAADVEVVDTGAKTATITINKNNKTSLSYIYAWEGDTKLLGNWPGTSLSSLPTDSNGYYVATVNFTNSYQIIFNNNGSTQSGDSASFTTSIKTTFTDNTNYDVEVTGDSTEGTSASFWVDLDGDSTTTYDIIYPDKSGTTYKIYLPSSVQYNSGGTMFPVTFFASEGTSMTIGNAPISSTGSTYNFQAGSYTIAGDISGSLSIKKSANVSSVHTITDEVIPQGVGASGIDDETGETVYYNHKDNYETTGSIVVFDEAGNQLNSNTELKKIKGRGNSSWKASYELIGKYAFNITLKEEAELLDESEASKKYCLVSYNADEARMRNMIVYELAQQIGVEYVADYEPVDLYNNGYYIGSYLLTDKVEIGNPLVDIVNLDKINEAHFGKDNYGDEQFRDCIDSCDINEKTAPGFDKYYDYSTLGLDDIDPSVYANSGFLLEFEIDDRFDDEMSGFISYKGQQIVCKYPEYATKAQLQYIENKWNVAEAIMYNENATYEQLSNVIDVESFAKMYLIQELTKNLDGCATSYYVYFHEGKLHAGVAWDYDWTLGQYDKEYTSRVVSSDFSDNVDADPSEWGGWYLNSKGIYVHEGTSTKLNAQAALCQNDAFWGVVTAEWNELFYSEALKFTDSEVATVSSLDCIIADFYSKVSASTAMDENKWGIIASDPLCNPSNNWGSTDTGDTHDAAVVSLNNWMYNRLTWMDKYLNPDNEYYPNIAPYNVDYTIQPPVLSLATDMPEGGFEVGTEVVVNIDDKTDGSYTYTIYKNGVVVDTTEDKFFTVTAASTEDDYTVIATSKTSGKVSEESEEITVKGSGYDITPSLNVSSSAVLIGDTVTLTPSIEENYTGVDYKIYYKVDGGEAQLLSGNTYTHNVAGLVEFYVVASVTIDNEPVTGTTEANPVKVTFSAFSVNVTASSNGSVMQGQNVTITATPSVEGNVTYTFYKDNEVIEGYENVTTNTYTEKMDDADSFVYKVVAKYGEKIAENTVTVTVTEFDGTFKVKVLFKSSTVYAYKPNMTINGSAVELVEDTAIEVNKVGNGISTYRWYSYTFAEEQTYGTEITVNVSGNRDYFYNASYTFEVGNTDYACDLTGGVSSYYLALDNLNDRSIKNLSNISDMDGYQRAWTESAVHMIYNAKLDGELIAPVGFSFRFADYGDANCDGKINIKDATYVQKSLANIVVADSLTTTVSDYNHDGKVTIKDATAIQKQIAGL